MASTPRLFAYLLLLITGLAIGIEAQSTTTSATLYPPPTGWSYVGCYNETTLANGTEGQRALNGGLQASDTMTVPLCLAFCQSNAYSFAGLEYTRECYCAPLLSALSAKLPDSSCNLPCKGNATQLCGGSLALNVYQVKSSTKGAGVKIGSKAPVGSILALGIAIGVLLCLA